MDLSNFSKSEQKKAILFWYETNAKGKKYGKKLTWDEFGGKCYLQNKNSMTTMLINYDKNGNVERNS